MFAFLKLYLHGWTWNYPPTKKQQQYLCVFWIQSKWSATQIHRLFALNLDAFYSSVKKMLVIQKYFSKVDSYLFIFAYYWRKWETVDAAAMKVRSLTVSSSGQQMPPTGGVSGFLHRSGSLCKAARPGTWGNEAVLLYPRWSCLHVCLKSKDNSHSRMALCGTKAAFIFYWLTHNIHI